MKLPNSILLGLASCLLNQGSAQLVTTTSNDTIVVQSEKLVGWEGCTPKQQKIVYEAWNSMLDIAYQVSSTTGWVPWGSPAANEFLGGFRSYNDHEDIQTVLNNAYTFKLAWGINWKAWKINVRCDDWLGTCANNPAAGAYTVNPGHKMGPKQPPSPTMDTINFCINTFFDNTQTCAEAWSTYGNDDEKKKDLRYYQCRGYVVLHELFHLDTLSRAGKQGHIEDMKMAYKPDPEVDPKPVVKYKKVYGPFMTKVLASWYELDVGHYVVRNADNLAQYALARWVESKLGSYPNLPPRGEAHPVKDAPPTPVPSSYYIDATGTLVFNETAIGSAILGPYIHSWDNLTSACNDVDETDCTNSTVRITSIAPNNNTNTNASASSILSQPSAKDWTPAPYNLPDDPYLDCYRGEGTGASIQPYVSRDFATNAIIQHCQTLAAGDSTLSADGLAIRHNPFPINNSTTLWVGASWQLGDPSCTTPRAITAAECVLQLATVVGRCDSNSATQKYGGVRVNNCVAWGVVVDNTTPVLTA